MKVFRIILQILLWLVVANGLVSIGIVAADQESLYLPQYGQGYWWAWKTALFDENSINLVFIIAGIICSFIMILILLKQGTANEVKNND